MPPKGGEIAPRTAIGTDKDGRLMILEVDGVEKLKEGLTLYEMAGQKQNLLWNCHASFVTLNSF